MKSLSILCILFVALSTVAGEARSSRYKSMDYGPFLSMTLNMGKETNGRDNSILKATVARLGTAEHEVNLAYDTERMSVVAAWSGGFIDFNGVIFNGNHHAQPRPKGELFKHSGGWGVEGKFDDPRADKRGPMPKELLTYHGLYRNGHSIVLAYSVGGCEILESPSFEDGWVVRRFKFGAAKQNINLAFSPPKSNEIHEALRALTSSSGVKISADAQRISFEIPAHSTEFSIAFKQKLDKMAQVESANDIQVIDDNTDWKAVLSGGPALWPQTVTTHGTLGKENGPYAVDSLTLPFENPYGAWIRPGGFDFFADGKRAAICTWSGDVWIVSGINETLENLTWKRFATGLYQPLGLKIVDEKIYLTCRDRIVRLHDLNNDGEADFYETFNDEFILSYHFHEFMLDLQTDAEGNFYFAKGGTPGVGGPNFDIVTPHSGAFFKLSKDGKKLDIVARGLRAPNGIGVGPNGELTSGDNEGSWVPVCPINDVRPHGFLGVVPESWPGEPTPDHRDPPICWIPWHVDNSAGAQVWVTSKKWGPFENEMFHLSYGKCSLFHVLTERVEGVLQGGVAKLPLQFSSGVMRARFNSIDGQLYACGLKGWQTTATADGTFERVRFTGKPVNLPASMQTMAQGVRITFTSMMDAATVGDVSNYGLWWFNVKWAKEYGSARWSPTDPTKHWEKSSIDPPGEELEIKSATLLPDGKTVELQIPGLKPVTNLILKMKLKTADGTSVDQQICSTIHHLPAAK